MTDERKAASNAEVESAAVSADAIAVLLSENTDIEDSSYVAVQIASLIEAGLAATLDQQVKHMVERFLRWRLPENFNPDCGITFKAIYNEHSPFGPSKAEPVGTNLFDYIQAEAMVRHMLDGLPVQAARAPQAPQGDGVVEALREAEELVGAIVGKNAPAREWALSVRNKLLAALAPKEGAPAADCDEVETVERNPKSWAAWKRRADDLDAQIERLAQFIMAEVPGEPSENEGAVDTAIRWMRAALRADLMKAALTAAGYRIIGPGEVDPVTVERCAEIARAAHISHAPGLDGYNIDIATALRSLTEAKP